MRTSFSAVDMTTRMEIVDLLSRFCHAIDYNQPQEWIELFRPDACVSAPRFGKFLGRDEVATIPALVAEEGEGAWRHIFNNVVIKICDSRKKYHIQAYCTVNDWRTRGTAIRCWDFSATLVRARYLQISELEMRPVGAFSASPRSYNPGLAPTAAEPIAIGN